MDFADAMNLVLSGAKMKRKNWNGKKQYIVLGFMEKCRTADGTEYQDSEHETEGGRFIMFVNEERGTYQCGWLASQADMLGNDWEEVEPGNNIPIEYL